MILGAFFILVFPIILVFRFRDLVDEWRSPSSSRDATNSDSSTSGVLDVGGGGCGDAGGCGADGGCGGH